MSAVVAIVLLDVEPLQTTRVGRLRKPDRDLLTDAIEGALGRLDDCWHAEVLDIETGSVRVDRRHGSGAGVTIALVRTRT